MIANSCTHRSPTCMHLKIYLWRLGSCSYIAGSIRDERLSSVHCIQAYNEKNYMYIKHLEVLSAEGYQTPIS